MTERFGGRISTAGSFSVSVLVALAVVASGCGSSEPAELPFTETADQSSELTANWDSLDSQVGSAAGSQAGSATAASAQFQDLLALLGTSYRFESRLSGSEGDSVELTGHRVGDALSYTMSTGGVTVEAVDLGDTIWTRVDDGPWGISDSVGGDDPILALSKPLSVEQGAGFGSFVVTYDRRVLGLEGEDPIPVLVVGVEDFQSQGPRMTFSALDESVTILSVLAGDPSLGPITAPE